MAAKKKVVTAAASSSKLPKGIATYNGKFYTNVYSGSYDTVEEAVAIRAKAMDFKASLKDVAPKVAAAPIPAEPAPVAAPAKNKGKFTWEADDIIVPTAKKKKSKVKAAPAAAD